MNFTNSNGMVARFTRWIFFSFMLVFTGAANAGCLDWDEVCMAPDVVIVSPANNATVTNSFRVDVLGTDGGETQLIYEVQLSVDGVPKYSKTFNPNTNYAQASFDITLPSGTHTLKGRVQDQGGRWGNSAIVTVNVSAVKASTTTALSASTGSPAFGQSVSFTATVSGNSPTGTVTFKDGSTTLSTVALSGNSATYATATLISGGHSITAVYNGDT